MQDPLVGAVVAMLCYGLSDFVYKRAAMAAIRADHFLMAQAWFFCPLVVVYGIASGALVPVPAALWSSLAGVLLFVGFYFFLKSLASGAVSTNASIFRMNFIVTAVLAIGVLGEPLTAAKIAGLALALAATWLLVGAAGSPGRPVGDTRRSLAEVGVATLAFGAANFFHTVGLRHGALPETLAVAQAALFMPLATLVVYARDRKFSVPPVTFTYGAAAALVLLGATIFLLRALAHGPASQLVPIAQMGFLVAALLGILVLREGVTARKAAGLSLALAALAILAAG